MNAFVRSFLALVVLIVALGGLAIRKLNEESQIRSHSYLLVDFYGDLPEYDDSGGVIGEALGQKRETLQRVPSNLEKARVDKRIMSRVDRFR